MPHNKKITSNSLRDGNAYPYKIFDGQFEKTQYQILKNEQFDIEL